MPFVTWNIAMLFHSASSTGPGAAARSRTKRTMLGKLLLMATVFSLRETRGQQYDVHQLAVMHDSWTIHSLHLAGSPAGGVAMGIRANCGRFLSPVFDISGRALLCLADVGGARMLFDRIHLEPSSPAEARRQRMRAMQAARRPHEGILFILGGDWISSVAGDGRFDLHADSVMPYIGLDGGDGISEEMADFMEVQQMSMTRRQEVLRRTSLLSCLDRIYLRSSWMSLIVAPLAWCCARLAQRALRQ